MIRVEAIPYKNHKEKFRLNKFLLEHKKEQKIKKIENLNGCIYVEYVGEVINT